MGAEDRETTIAFTDADEEMQVYTANRKLQNRLKKLGFEPTDEDKQGKFFEVPRDFLQFRKPRDFDLSEEEREERRERLREARKAAGIGEFAKKKAGPAKKKKKAEPEPEDDDDVEEEEDEDFEDEEEETEVVRPKARKKPAASSSKRKSTTRKKS